MENINISVNNKELHLLILSLKRYKRVLYNNSNSSAFDYGQICGLIAKFEKLSK